MDGNGIDRAVICPVEERIILHYRDGNDFIARQARAHPTRFIGFAVANPCFCSEPRGGRAARPDA
jgi:predicted TIM-barrel fold metal-dependent hydrolase